MALTCSSFGTKPCFLWRRSTTLTLPGTYLRRALVQEPQFETEREQAMILLRRIHEVLDIPTVVERFLFCRAYVTALVEIVASQADRLGNSALMTLCELGMLS